MSKSEGVPTELNLSLHEFLSEEDLIQLRRAILWQRKVEAGLTDYEKLLLEYKTFDWMYVFNGVKVNRDRGEANWNKMQARVKQLPAAEREAFYGITPGIPTPCTHRAFDQDWLLGAVEDKDNESFALRCYRANVSEEKYARYIRVIDILEELALSLQKEDAVNAAIDSLDTLTDPAFAKQVTSRLRLVSTRDSEPRFRPLTASSKSLDIVRKLAVDDLYLELIEGTGNYQSFSQLLLDARTARNPALLRMHFFVFNRMVIGATLIDVCFVMMVPNQEGNLIQRSYRYVLPFQK